MKVDERILVAAKHFENEWPCNLLYVNSDIDEDAIRYIVQATESADKADFLFLFLETNDGRAESATAIARYLKEKYHWISVVALDNCSGPGVAMCSAFDDIWVNSCIDLSFINDDTMTFHFLDDSDYGGAFQEFFEMHCCGDYDNVFVKDLHRLAILIKSRMTSTAVEEERRREIGYFTKSK